MSVALRESEMAEELKENDEDLDINNTNANFTFDESIMGGLDGDDTNNATIATPIMRRRASFNMNNASAAGVNTASNTNSMDAMQQRQFNKAARRASRLSINMDITAAQMFSMGIQTASMASSSSSSLSRTMLKNTIKMTADERIAISTLFQYFREHPNDLLALSTKLSTFQVRIYK